MRALALARALVATLALGAVSGPALARPTPAAVYPPWSHGRNDPAVERGLDFTVPDADVEADFHGNLADPKLVLFVGGNYFFAMAPLAAEFVREHPAYRGDIFYATIPPGLLARAMRLDDTFTSGNLTFRVVPDVYAAGRKNVDALVRDGTLRAPAISYVTNDLTIMIPRANPARIRTLRDLGRPGVRLVMPNPAYEGVVRQIESSLRKAGGARLVEAVYATKVRDGQTVLTHIHHRQTPLFLMQGLGDAGVTWRSEALFHERVGHPLSHVDIPAAFNSTAVYGAALTARPPHRAAGMLWLAFLKSRAAFAIFRRYGFKAVPAV